MKIILIIGLALAVFQGETPVKNEAALIEKLITVAKKTTSIQCDFVQEKHLSFSKEPLISKGEMFYQGQNMRWDQTVPKNHLIVITDEELKIKEDGKVSTHKLDANKYMRGLKEIMMGTMTGTLLESPLFASTYFETEKQYLVKLSPKKGRLKNMFQIVILKFNKKTLHMEEVVMQEESGDFTKINFIDPIFNQKISSETFKL